VVHEIVQVTGLELHKIFLTRAIQNPQILSDLHGSFGLALDLYRAAGLFRGQEITRSLRVRISNWSKKRFGTCLGSYKAINLSFTKSLDMAGIRKWVFDIIRNCQLDNKAKTGCV
jgi:hypothetical protein